MKKVISSVAALAVLAIVGSLFWLFVVNVQQADPSVKAGLIGLLGVLTGALITHYQTKKREIVTRHFADKREGYMNMIDLLFDLIIGVKKGKQLTEQEMLKRILPFKKALIVWGGPEVIDAWNRFEISSDGDMSPEEMIREMERILRAIRKDLGHDDSALKFGSLWGLMLVPKDKKIALGED